MTSIILPFVALLVVSFVSCEDKAVVPVIDNSSGVPVVSQAVVQTQPKDLTLLQGQAPLPGQGQRQGAGLGVKKCVGSVCGCYTGWCWKYTGSGASQWCWTQVIGANPGQDIWATCGLDNDCYEEMTCSRQ